MTTPSPCLFTAAETQITEDQLIYFDNIKLQLKRVGQEWQIEYAYKAAVNEISNEEYKTPVRHRIIVNPDKSALTLQLRLANRPIVSRPPEKLFLAPNARATLYLFSTLWLCISLEETVLLEIPCQVLSDIWFGPNTRAGELAYSNTANVVLELPPENREPDKALTALTVVNKGAEQLSLEKINLPVPELKLYRFQDKYQTDNVEIIVDEDKEARLTIKSLGQHNGDAIQLCEARKTVSRSALNRAVDVLFA